MKAIVDILLVGCGSFAGGVARFLVSKALLRSGHGATLALYVAASLVLGFAAVLAGHCLGGKA